MPRCKYCNVLKPPGECIQDPDCKSNQYCSEEHMGLYKKERAKSKPKPVKVVIHNEVEKPPASPPSPTPPSDMRKLTDYIQAIWPVEPNWKWFARQIKNLCTETGLTHNEMRIVLRYCIEYKELQVDENYGLQQFVPRYVKEAMDFRDDVRRIKSQLDSIDFEDEYQPVPIGRPKLRRRLKEDVGF